MRPQPAQPVLLGDPGSAEQLAQVSGLAVLALAGLGCLGLAGEGLIRITTGPRWPTGFHPVPVTALSVVALCLAVGGHRRPGLFSPQRLRYLLPLAAVVLALAASQTGPSFGSLVTLFFLWFASSMTYLRRRDAFVVMGWAGLVLGVLLAVQKGNTDPLVDWDATVGLMVSLAFFSNRLVDRSWNLAQGERAARSETEMARAELETVSERKTRFLARMSHELRTPLNAIIGFSEMLAQRSFGDLTAKQGEYVTDIVDSGRHLLALVDEVLDVAKVETGALDLDVGPVDVGELLAGSATLFEEQAGRRRVTLVVEVEPGLPTIQADARKLKQVLFNLVANAVRFTPPGGRITLGGRSAHHAVRFSVSDTGPGIPTDQQEAIFEAFRQAHAGAGGTGLGLPLARRLVEQHGGRLWVDSAPGEGARFSAELTLRACVGGRGNTSPMRVEAGSGRLVLGEPDSSERRIETGRLLGIGALSMAAIAAVMLVVLRVHPVPGMRDYPEAAIAAGGILAVLTTIGLARFPQHIAAPAVLPYVSILPILCVAAVVATGQFPLRIDLFALVYVWMTGVAFLMLTPRQLALIIGAIGLGYAHVLAVQDGFVAPVAHWVVGMGCVVTTGLMFQRFVGRIQQLAEAERSARREAEKARAELEIATRHKSEFLANMSHELRTPLNVIIGFSEVLESQVFGPLNDKQAEYVADVLSSGRHLLALINDILDLAKIDAGRMELEVGEIDLAELLAGTLRPFRAGAAERGIDLRLEAGDDLGMLTGDESKLAQGLRRLLSNSLQSSPDGGSVKLSAARHGNQVMIAVRDSGAGIDPFDQGLALARRYAQLHGGTLDATDCDRGVAFILCLPASPVSIEAAGAIA
jgi:signal transduction histidine kinase